MVKTTSKKMTGIQMFSILKCLVQWGSEYQTSLVFEWSKKEIGCQMVWFLNAI